MTKHGMMLSMIDNTIISLTSMTLTVSIDYIFLKIFCKIFLSAITSKNSVLKQVAIFLKQFFTVATSFPYKIT